MKCPKCSYLGFETGDRCKNCGYDFSLLPTGPSESWPEAKRHAPQERTAPAWTDIETSEAAAGEEPDLILRDPTPELPPSQWFEEVDASLSVPDTIRPADPPRLALAKEVAAEPPVAEKPALPLFTPGDDEPLVRLPAAPRPPLAVRRTPDTPRLRTIPNQIRRQTPDRDHVLLFGEEQNAAARSRPEPTFVEPSFVEPAHAEESPVPRSPAPASRLRASGVRPRLLAALIDHSILLTIDLVVVYFTLRMAALTLGDWPLLPALPMLAFLGLVKLAYFSAFTTIGGQTIGKMAAHIRVVADDAGRLDVARAIERAAAVLASIMTLGIGFLPALFGSDHRAFHDRVARTRVVALPSA